MKKTKENKRKQILKLAQLKFADNFEAGNPMLPTKTEKIKFSSVFEPGGTKTLCRRVSDHFEAGNDAADQN
jgi:hypothetical protein